ncbi:MAG TPA: DUF2461 domain-containing protein, partial [Sunxiuqinia sp.]|nr:DUF2461 domain-containing protein [Sunxiuqinia sp.]
MKLLIDFLKDLRKNNHKEWFDNNRDHYEESRQQMLFFTELMIQEIAKFDPDIPMLNPKECLFRIYRDVRFSKDKTPYKTHMGAFVARNGRKSDRAGYYIHIEPGNSFLGGGVWGPAADHLKAIRSEIFDNAEGFREIINDEDFQKYYSHIHGDKLKTAPKGFPKDFEDVDLLRYKSYAFGFQVPDKTIVNGNLVEVAVDAFQELYK